MANDSHDNYCLHGNGPQLIHTVPRRPFELRSTSPVPDGEHEQEHCQKYSFEQDTDFDTADVSASDICSGGRHLPWEEQPGGNNNFSDHDDRQLPSARSMANLTASTLWGIYAPGEDEQLQTPRQGHSGSQTPVLHPSFTPVAGRCIASHAPLPLTGHQRELLQQGVELDKSCTSLLRRRLSASLERGHGMESNMTRTLATGVRGTEIAPMRAKLSSTGVSSATTSPAHRESRGYMHSKRLPAHRPAARLRRRLLSRRTIMALLSRALVLGALGMGWGALITSLGVRRQQLLLHRGDPFGYNEKVDEHDDVFLEHGNVAGGGSNTNQIHSAGALGLPETVSLGCALRDWRFLFFWGALGIVLGSLLPWVDVLWENALQKRKKKKKQQQPVSAGEKAHVQNSEPLEYGESDFVKGGWLGRVPKQPAPGTDWPLVMRSIGVFAGIVFAIRRLPWTSSSQVSTTLALINPFLWYLIDRSSPGFFLSTLVAIVGAAILLGLEPHPTLAPLLLSPFSSTVSPAESLSSSSSAGETTISSPFFPANAPTPPCPSSSLLASKLGNGSSSDFGTGVGMATASADVVIAVVTRIFGCLTRQDTAENAIWVLSVLFCSCVCFGDIGRRLAWRKNVELKGRWAGVR